MNLARHDGAAGDYARALSAATIARDLWPQHPGPHANLAFYALLTGDLESVRVHLARLESLSRIESSVSRALQFSLFSDSPRARSTRMERRRWMHKLEREFPTLIPAGASDERSSGAFS